MLCLLSSLIDFMGNCSRLSLMFDVDVPGRISCNNRGNEDDRMLAGAAYVNFKIRSQE